MDYCSGRSSGVLAGAGCGVRGDGKVLRDAGVVESCDARSGKGKHTVVGEERSPAQVEFLARLETAIHELPQRLDFEGVVSAVEMICKAYHTARQKERDSQDWLCLVRTLEP